MLAAPAEEHWFIGSRIREPMARANSACVSPLVCHDVASERGLNVGSIVASTVNSAQSTERAREAPLSLFVAQFCLFEGGSRGTPHTENVRTSPDRDTSPHPLLI